MNSLIGAIGNNPVLAALAALFFSYWAFHNVRLRIWKAQLRFTGEPTHAITVPRGPDGRPGETFVAPSLSRSIGVISSDGSRTDATVMVGRRSYLLVACLGRVAEMGDASDCATFSINAIQKAGAGNCVSPPVPRSFAGAPGVMYWLKLRNGRLLREMKFDHRGWSFGVGVLTNKSEAAAAEELAEAVLATWRWLDDSQPTPAAVQPPGSGRVTLITPQ